MAGEDRASEQHTVLCGTNPDFYFQRKSDRNVGWAQCIFLGEASDKSNIFETREARQVETQIAEDGREVLSQEEL